MQFHHEVREAARPAVQSEEDGGSEEQIRTDWQEEQGRDQDAVHEESSASILHDQGRELRVPESGGSSRPVKWLLWEGGGPTWRRDRVFILFCYVCILVFFNEARKDIILILILVYV